MIWNHWVIFEDPSITFFKFPGFLKESVQFLPPQQHVLSLFCHIQYVIWFCNLNKNYVMFGHCIREIFTLNSAWWEPCFKGGLDYALSTDKMPRILNENEHREELCNTPLNIPPADVMSIHSTISSLGFKTYRLHFNWSVKSWKFYLFLLCFKLFHVYPLLMCCYCFLVGCFSIR